MLMWSQWQNYHGGQRWFSWGSQAWCKTQQNSWDTLHGFDSASVPPFLDSGNQRFSNTKQKCDPSQVQVEPSLTNLIP